MLFVCEQYGQWRAVTSRCTIQWGESYLEAMLGGTTAMFLCQQSSMSYGRVEGEGRVQHEVCGAALGTRGDDGVRRRDEGERRVRAQPVPRGGAECGDVGGDGQHGDGAVLTACGAR